jgi:hypothetical protein
MVGWLMMDGCRSLRWRQRENPDMSRWTKHAMVALPTCVLVVNNEIRLESLPSPFFSWLFDKFWQHWGIQNLTLSAFYLW